MSETKELLRRGAEGFAAREGVMDSLIRRRARKNRNRRMAAVALAIGLTLATFAGLIRTFGNLERPADEPKDIFARVHGWITYRNKPLGIWAVSPKGRADPVLLSDHDGDPLAWSPDGSTLLIGPTSGNVRLFALHADGSETRLPIACADFPTNEVRLDFSPDGSQLICSEDSRIFTVDLNSGRRRYILRRFAGYSPSFSPDATQIAYFYGGGDYSNGLRVMNADGSRDRVLIDRDGLFKRQGWLYDLGWSADGSHLAFQHATVERGHGVAGVWVIDADGSALRMVAHGRKPQWSPTGTQLVFEADSGIWVFDVETSQLTRASPSGRDPSWSPDGTRISFLDFLSLYVVHADGTHRREIDVYGQPGPWNPLPLSASGSDSATPTVGDSAAASVPVDRESATNTGGSVAAPLVFAIAAMGALGLLLLAWRRRRNRVEMGRR